MHQVEGTAMGRSSFCFMSAVRVLPTRCRPYECYQHVADIEVAASCVSRALEVANSVLTLLSTHDILLGSNI
eukprot:scaffold2634_cov108-Skeletonema_menzelii.AAC.2